MAKPDDITGAFRDADQFVLRHVKRCEPLKWSVQLELLNAYQKNGDKRALDLLMRSHQRTVVDIAFRYLNRGLDKADLIQEGNVGLLKAIKLFNPSKCVRLITYATWWILDTVQNAVRRKAKIMKQGSTMQKSIQKEWNKTRVEKGYSPTPKEIALKCNISEADVVHNQLMICEIISLDSPSQQNRPNDWERGPLVDVIEDVRTRPIDEMAEVNADTEELELLLQKIDPEDREFIERKFGLFDGFYRTKSQMSELYAADEYEITKREKRIIEQLQSMRNDLKMNERRSLKDRKAKNANLPKA